MPRPRKPARLWLDEAEDRWYIRDFGGVKECTGYAAGDREKAEGELAKYLEKKRDAADPAKQIRKDSPNQTRIKAVLTLEAERVAAAPEMPTYRKLELIAVFGRMGEWFGDKTVGDLDGELQENYANERMKIVRRKVAGQWVYQTTNEHAPIAAYRDLKLLAAGINRYLKKKIGGVQTKFSPVLPEAPQTRLRWLTRDEAAKLLWTAWRKKNVLTGAYTSRHIARFILVGLYTGSRAGDICNAGLLPSLNRGRVDLDRGIFQRKPDGKKATSKLQPTVPIPPRLLAHMRRWQRRGISNHSVIEFNGKAVGRVREGYNEIVRLAGFFSNDPRMNVVQHTLRHTAISWYLHRGVPIDKVSDYCGVSEATIKKVYRHLLPDAFDDLLEAAHFFGRSRKGSNR